jgi:hypothetical protein
VFESSMKLSGMALSHRQAGVAHARLNASGLQPGNIVSAGTCR